MGAGYGGYEGATGTIQVAQNNLFGTGRRLVGSLRISSIATYYDIRFTEPRVNDTLISAGLIFSSGNMNTKTTPGTALEALSGLVSP